jgi:hypothetical protein
MRHWLARHLHYLADRLAPDESFRCTGFSFTFERGVGVAFHERGEEGGCPIWYFGPDHGRAWTEAATQWD